MQYEQNRDSLLNPHVVEVISAQMEFYASGSACFNKLEPVIKKLAEETDKCARALAADFGGCTSHFLLLR